MGRHHRDWAAPHAELGTNFHFGLCCFAGAYRSVCGSGDLADAGPAHGSAELRFGARRNCGVLWRARRAWRLLALLLQSARNARGLCRSCGRRQWRTPAEHFHHWLVAADKRCDERCDVSAEKAGGSPALDRERMDRCRVVFPFRRALYLRRLWTASIERRGTFAGDRLVGFWCGEWFRFLRAARQGGASGDV